MARSIASARSLPGVAATDPPLDRSRAAFEAAVTPLYAPLLRRLTLVLRDPAEAEDAAQEAYVRAFQAWPRFVGADVRGWLWTIGLRTAFDGLRRRRRRLAWFGRRAGEGTYEDRTDPDLWAALGRLEPRVRAALLANVLDGYTQREVAMMLAVPEGTVASWLSRARASLRDALEPDG